MVTLSTSEVIMTDKNYRQITINIFKKYSNEHFEDKL